MTAHQTQCLDRYEKELRSGLPPIDRSVDLNVKVLAVRVQETKAILAFSGWSPEKLYAAAIIWLWFLGYDPEEELAIAERMNSAGEVGEPGTDLPGAN